MYLDKGGVGKKSDNGGVVTLSLGTMATAGSSKVGLGKEPILTQAMGKHDPSNKSSVANTSSQNGSLGHSTRQTQICCRRVFPHSVKLGATQGLELFGIFQAERI